MSETTSGMIQKIEDEQRRMRRKALLWRVLHGLGSTVQVRGLTPEMQIDDVRVDFTDQSEAYLAPLIEAVFILEDIVFASDGCRGHRDCVHSMDPWRLARELLQGKWEADTGERRDWPPRAWAQERQG